MNSPRLPGGRLLLTWLASLASALPAAEPMPGQPLPPWQAGQLDIHQINTGTGDAALFVLPDGTTFLLDAGAVDRTGERAPQYDAPPRPDASRRPGEWIAAYVRRFHPDGAQGRLDYAALTHFHGDHMGTLTPASPPSTAAGGAYRLTGITDVGDVVPIRTLLDRGWPDYAFPAPSGSPMMANYRAFLAWQVRERGLEVVRFEPGRADQIVLRRRPEAYPEFEIRHIAANGRVWTGGGTASRNRFPPGIVPVENNCSLAFRLRYGAFAYFNGGDMAGYLRPDAPAWTEMESAVAWVTGPVDVHALNHHGTQDAVNAFFLSVLRPRVHILSTYASSQPSPDVMRRMLSERIYPGPRDLFLTNTDWPGRRGHMVKLFGEVETARLQERLGQVASRQGHVVVRVESGGARYRVIVLDDAVPEGLVRSVHGPYASRGTEP